MIVIDSSVALKWIFAEEKGAAEATRVRDAHVSGKSEIAVPALFFYEIANVLAMQAKLSTKEALEAFELQIAWRKYDPARATQAGTPNEFRFVRLYAGLSDRLGFKNRIGLVSTYFGAGAAFRCAATGMFSRTQTSPLRLSGKRSKAIRRPSG